MPAPAPVNLSINQLTDKTVDGNGIFDCLMTTMNKHIESQYTKGRIRDTDYAELYTQAIQSTLSQSIEFMIQTKRAAADIDLTRQKLETEKEQTKLVIENVRIATKEYDLKSAQISKLTKDEELVDQEILLKEQQVNKLIKDEELIDQEILLKREQVVKLAKDSELVDQEILLKQQQVSKLSKDEELVDQEILLKEQQVSKLAKDEELVDQEILVKQQQVSKLAKDEELIDQEILLKEQQVSKLSKDEELVDQEILLKEQQVVKLSKDSELIDQEILVKQQEVLESVQKVITAQKQNAILDKQALKIMEETELLTAKHETEVAQIRDTVNGIAVTGIIGKQVALYDAQKEGFKRDAEQKLAKLMADLWAVDKSTDNSVARPFTGTATNPVDTAFSDPDIVSVFKKAIAGIDV